jgi:hypothetical protein
VLEGIWKKCCWYDEVVSGLLEYLFNEVLTRKDGSRLNPKGRSYSGSDSAPGDELAESMTKLNRSWSAEETKAIMPIMKLGLVFVPGIGPPTGTAIDLMDIAIAAKKGDSEAAVHGAAAVGLGETAKHAAAITTTAVSTSRIGGVLNWIVDQTFGAARDYFRSKDEPKK